MEKVQSCLKQLVRDWSADGAKEREAAYDKITNKLCDLYKDKVNYSRVVFLFPNINFPKPV